MCRLLVLLLAVVTVFGGGTHLVHGIQVQRNAKALLDRARSAEAGADWAKAEQSLDEYLQLRPQDGAAWEDSPGSSIGKQSDRRRLERVFIVHEQALRYNPGNPLLERRCADLAIEMRRYSDARRILRSLDEKIPRDSLGQPAAVDRTALAELEDLQGQCDVGLSRFDVAEQFFNKALEHDPRRVSCYDRLARLRRSEAAKRSAERSRGRHHQDNGGEKPPGRSGRTSIAGGTCETSRRPPTQATFKKPWSWPQMIPRCCLPRPPRVSKRPTQPPRGLTCEKGLELDPKNLALALGLASLESRERHHDHAEKVLRKALNANPSVALIFTLAEALILQGKIEGNDQAGDYIARLRNMGLGDSYVPYLEAEILFQQKKWAEAFPRSRRPGGPANRSSAHHPAQPHAGRMPRSTGRNEQRLEALRQVADRDRGPESARIALAEALARTGKLEEALAILSPLADRQPRLKLEVIALLIQKTLRLPRQPRRWEEVEQRLQEAKQAVPGAVDDLTAMNADVLGFQGKADAAREILERAIELKPNSVRLRIALAAWLLRRNDMGDAEKVFDQAETDLGTSPGLLRARIGFWSGRGRERGQKNLGQLALARHRIPAAERPAFLEELARAFYRLGEFESGRSAL